MISQSFKYYVGWKLTEMAIIMSGLGYNPNKKISKCLVFQFKN